MGRIAKVGEDATLASTLATDPTPDIDLELLLVLLGRQTEAWRNLAQAQRGAGTPEDVLFAYEKMVDNVQLVFSKISEIRRSSSGDIYTRRAVQEVAALKEWAEDELAFSSDPDFHENTFTKSFVRLIQTLLGILEEFI